MTTTPSVILATRIHLGKQSSPPDQLKLINTLTTFLKTASTINASQALIAVDPEEKIEGYDLVTSITQALDEAQQATRQVMEETGISQLPPCTIIKVSPWGSFVPALNALTSWACQHQNESYGNTVIMFLSAETSVKKETVLEMSYHMADDTLVVGAALPGHDYRGSGSAEGIEVDLNGRTCPWNTSAMWNLNKLAMVGFPLVGDGLHQQEDGSPVAPGIEEFATVLLHQKMMGGSSTLKAKLVKVSGVEWEQNFEDEERRKWHETKMKSKFTRAEVHRSILGGGTGKVIHY